MSVQIDVPAAVESPEQITARETAEAAAIARGETVDIRYQNKSTGQVVRHTPTEGDPPVRPDSVPEKFWNAETGEVNLEALLKSQADGAAEISRLQQAKPEVTPPVTPPVTPKPGEQPQAIDSASAITAAREEYAKNNALTSETYGKLAEAGLDRNMVDGWITGVQAKQSELTDATYKEAGGEENFNKISAWAATNMDAATIATINTLLASDNPQVVAQGAAQLKANYDKNADIDPNVTLTGKGDLTGGGEHFASKYEMTKAMSDPRYKKDAAFRAQVAQKMARSTVLKINLFT